MSQATGASQGHSAGNGQGGPSGIGKGGPTGATQVQVSPEVLQAIRDVVGQIFSTHFGRGGPTPAQSATGPPNGNGQVPGNELGGINLFTPNIKASDIGFFHPNSFP
jgi:hypothetical protein